MPLSEDEQRILHQIEEQFYEHDPDLAGEIGQHAVDDSLARQMRWAAALFLLGLIVLVVALASATSFLVSFAGFVVMLGAALWFERSLRLMGRAAMSQMPGPFGNGGLRDYFGDTGDRMRSRLRNEGDEPDENNQSDSNEPS